MKMTMMINIDTLGTKLVEAIESKDKVRINAIISMMEDCLPDPIAVKWITEPVNISNIHNKLVEHMGVHPKLLMLKTRVPNRNRRAGLFVQVLKNAMTRV